jgi:hypothetical protein
MATDFAVAMFQLPVLLGVLFLAVIAFVGRNNPVGPASFLGVGRSRLALGYLAATAAILLYAGFSAADLVQQKAALGHYSITEGKARWAGSALYLFVLITPFVVAAITGLGLPAMALLRRVRFASVFGAVLSALVLALGAGAWSLIWPHNSWCASNPLLCSWQAIVSVAALSVPVAVAFALGCRLPWLTSAPLQANNPSKPTPLGGAD